MVQVGYLLYDQKQHILTLSRADIDLDAANTPEMIVHHEVEYLSVNDVDRPSQNEELFCFDQLLTKGEIVVLVCEE